MDYRDREIYESARRKSVSESHEQLKVKYNKLDLKNARKEGFRKGAEAGLKRGFIAGAMIAILACSGISMAKNTFVNNFMRDTSNPSVEAGYHAVIEETHRTNDNQGYWYDYSDIASSFDADTMDFDAFVYGNYKKVGWNQESRLSCMDELFYQFKLCGVTDCSTFLSYCESKGVCKEVDGKLQVDTKAYEEAIREYLVSLNEARDLEESIDNFKHGM